jgi:hypothetical protein
MRSQRDGRALPIAASKRVISSAARSFARWLDTAGFEIVAAGVAA